MMRFQHHPDSKIRFTTLLQVTALAAGIFLPSLLSFHADPTPKVKSADEYWAETGLGTAELEMILDENSCESSEASYLGCINALNRMGERYDLALGANGQWRPLKKSDGDNEKQQLAPWQPKAGIRGAFWQTPHTSLPFMKRWEELRAGHVKPNEISAVIGNGINGFLSVAHDPHTYILPVAEYQELIASSESKQDKLGFIFRRNGNKLIVRKIFKGSPAAKAGLRKYDEITAIGDKKIADLSSNQVSELLRMPSSESIDFTLSRGGDQHQVSLTRSTVTYSSVESELQSQPIPVGIITLHKFSKDVCIGFKQNLIQMIESGAKGMIVDLRDNPGGQLDEAACIANLFVKKGTKLFETRFLDALKPSESYVAENEMVYSGPLAILINSGSASASEILAGALKDQSRATLVGERTFGKGSFQDGRIWANNAKIALFQTEGLYYFPSGWTPQMVGLEPDVPVRDVDLHDREADLFTNPIVPRDQWTGPQSLAWLNQIQCMPSTDSILKVAIAGMGSTSPDDDQIENAVNWIACKQKNLFGSQRTQ